jgi:hypothetical protein
MKTSAATNNNKLSTQRTHFIYTYKENGVREKEDEKEGKIQSRR